MIKDPANVSGAPRACRLVWALAAALLGFSPLPVRASQSVALGWDAPPELGVIDYIVYCGTRSRLYSLTYRSHSETQVTLPDLKDGTSYYFVVSAVTWFGTESDASTEIEFRTPGQTPSDGTPLISSIPISTTYINLPTVAIPFTISDTDTPVDQLILAGTSSELAIARPSDITFDGTGSNRTVTINPIPGRGGYTVITIAVTDGVHTNSTAFDLNVEPFTPETATLALDQQGAGSVYPNLLGQELHVGKAYKVTARPDATSLFAGWMAPKSALPSLRFLMRPGLVLRPVFVLNPFIATAGSYTGLFQEDGPVRPNSAGMVTITTTTRGTFSGKLQLAGKSHSFSGQLDLDRKATLNVNRRGTNALALNLAFGNGTGLNEADGSVADFLWQSPLKAHRAVFDPKNHPAQFAARQTLILPGQDDPSLGPEGDGIGAVRVDTRGRASTAGTLSDGVAFSQAASISQDGSWPVCVSLSRGQEMLFGWLAVATNPAATATGLLHHIRTGMSGAKVFKEGFSNQTAAVTAPYVRPYPATQPVINLQLGLLTLEGGDLTSVLSNSVALTSGNKILDLSDHHLSMKFALASGLFSGSLTHPDTGKKIAFKGALQQPLDRGSGFSLGTNGSARVVLQPVGP